MILSIILLACELKGNCDDYVSLFWYWDEDWLLSPQNWSGKILRSSNVCLTLDSLFKKWIDFRQFNCYNLDWFNLKKYIARFHIMWGSLDMSWSSDSEHGWICSMLGKQIKVCTFRDRDCYLFCTSEFALC